MNFPKRDPVFSLALKRHLDLDRADLGVPEIPGLWDMLLSDAKRKRPVPERA